jgi:hypothetical protein
MSLTAEMQSAAADKRTAAAQALARQIETVRSLKAESTETLAAQIEPLALALAALCDETRRTLEQVERTARENQQQTAASWGTAAKSWGATIASFKIERMELQAASERAAAAAQSLSKYRKSVTAKAWISAILTGALTATLLLTAYVAWQPPLSHAERQAVEWYRNLSPADQERVISQVRSPGQPPNR